LAAVDPPDPAELERLRRANEALRAELARRKLPHPRSSGANEDSELYRAVVVAMAEGVVVHDLDGAIIACNPSAETILGLSRDQMAGRTSLDPRWRSIRADGSPFPGDQHPAMVTLATGEPLRDQIMGVHKPDGQLTWISINTEPIFEDTDPRPSAVVASFADITAREHARSALTRSEERLRLALSAARLGIWEWSIADQSVYWSDTVDDIFGLAPGAFDGSFDGYQARIHPDDRALVEGALARALAGDGDRYEIEHRTVTPSGEVRWLRCLGRVIHGADGAPAGMRGVVADVSERRTLEEQLLHTRKMESIGRLAGGIAHDFNNLLAAIIASNERALALAADQPALRQVLQITADASTRASQLTRQLITFAQGQPVALQRCEPDHIIAELGRLLSAMLGDDIELTLRCDAAPWVVSADPHQLEQIVLNLAVNAREAMPGGGALTIETRALRVDAAYARQRPGLVPGEYVLIRVADQGRGIAPEVAERIFEPFFSTKEGGSGLGLATCYGITQGCGGHIECASEGRGAVFRVYLPRAQEHPGEERR
jgi:PAS domain S-box-containing protein